MNSTETGGELLSTRIRNLINHCKDCHGTGVYYMYGNKSLGMVCMRCADWITTLREVCVLEVNTRHSPDVAGVVEAARELIRLPCINTRIELHMALRAYDAPAKPADSAEAGEGERNGDEIKGYPECCSCRYDDTVALDEPCITCLRAGNAHLYTPTKPADSDSQPKEQG